MEKGLLRNLGGAGLLLFLAVSCAAPRTWDPQSAQEGVRKIFQLSAAEMVFHEVIYHYNESRWFFVTYGTKETLFSIDLKVQGGFDLAEGWTVEPGNDQKLVTVTFPAPKILLVNAVDSSIQEYFAAGEPLGYERLRGLLKDRSKKIETEAVSRGLLDRSRAQARTFAQAFFHSLGFERVVVQFRDPAILPVPGKNPG